MVPVLETVKTALRRPVTVKFGTRVMRAPGVEPILQFVLPLLQVKVTSPLNTAVPTVHPLKLLTIELPEQAANPAPEQVDALA